MIFLASVVDELLPELVLTALVMSFVAAVFFWNFLKVFVLGDRGF